MRDKRDEEVIGAVEQSGRGVDNRLRSNRKQREQTSGCRVRETE